jgi:diacylglycerol kinase (ATP)
LVKKSGRKILFVVNPKAGNSDQDYLSKISGAADMHNFTYEIYKTTGEGDDKKIRNYINEFIPETIVAVGGDGTVNMVARELMGTNIKLGIIPAGSANGLAYNLGITENIRSAINIIMESPPQLMDVISINDKYICMHLSDIGLNARIVKRFEEEGSKGIIGYGKQLFKELFEGKTYFSFRLRLPGKLPMKLKAEMLVIANAKSYGTGAIINPKGNYNDGLFEVVVIKPYPWWFAVSLLFAFLTGKLHKIRYIKVFSTPEAFVSLSEPQDFQVDGEVVPKATELRIKIIPGALKVLGA